MTILATHPIAKFERLRLLFRGDVERVTDQAPGGFRRRFSEIQNPSDTLGNLVPQHAESSRVFVLRDPDGVFVLKNWGGDLRPNAAVATTGRAPTRANVLAGRKRLLIVNRCRRLR